MDDWQGCLDPQCQTALLRARESVERRGGSVITVEDYLLALLENAPAVARFLRGCGVDLDELTRTIQCEQPIVTEVGGEGQLSSQLMYWFASARETSDSPWLGWSQLLETLVRHAERLQEKAYVAVFELVPRWPDSSEERDPAPIDNFQRAPVVVTDSPWVELAEDVAISLAASPSAMIWVRGERGAGKTAWLQSLLPALEQDYVELDLRRETEIMASDLPVLPELSSEGGPSEDGPRWPVLVLDNISPADLIELMDLPDGLASALVLQWAGPILLLGPDEPIKSRAAASIQHRLGRTLDIFDMPVSSVVQRRAVLTAHQAAIEKQWNVQISRSAIRFAASRQSRCVSTPGGMLQWLERAAARLNLFARRGPAEAVALAGQADTLRRQSLVALARQEPLDDIEASLGEIQLHRVAAEVAWHERKAAGTLRRLCAEDLRQELERWVAARPGPVHYVLHCNQQDGDSAGAGSGNLHS
ncbi:hypothetical protein [Marinobacter adhaerens]|uniref:hypothetical protein n=1 Tax=Marinobacter adhaerens TaxID=1033846 RepID=UPI001E46A7F4|nr:hypothetical protein [Marinobacter adhaerens]MCD1648518.1 hypothetical protein [Marinobacter adhaerens]